MLPPECFGQLLLVCTADDANSEWSLGVVRARPEYLRPGTNRDAKSGLNVDGKLAVEKIFWGAPMLENVLLHIDPETLARVTDPRASGQRRVNDLFRLVDRRRIGRNIVATVAQQDDYMKRVRANGGARTALAPEGYLIMGGDYQSHRNIAALLNVAVPEPGEFVSVQVALASADDPYVVELDGALWRAAEFGDPVVTAPTLPSTTR